MARRRYEMGKRARSAEETRRRLVEATVALHAEQGIADTTMKQIAHRAGVSVGTAYHHFPTYDDAIVACGTHVTSVYKPPAEEIFTHGMTLADRVAALTRAMFAFYDWQVGLEDARRAADRFPIVRAFLDAEEEHRRAMSARALRPDLDDKRASDAFAVLLDIGVLRGLQRAGLTTAQASDIVSDIAATWINGQLKSGTAAAHSSQEDPNADKSR